MQQQQSPIPSTKQQHVLRIKRRRTEDPLQALLFDNHDNERKSKRTKLGASAKSSRVVFKLARTDERSQASVIDLSSVLERSGETNNVFNLPKTEVTSNEVNPELLDMLNEYLKVSALGTDSSNNNPKPPKRRESITSNSNNPLESSNEDNEYVYDVYLRDNSSPITDEAVSSNIGYLQLLPSEARLLLDSATSSTASSPGASKYTDDEDSNDENFYRNDYPEDEDGGYNPAELSGFADDSDGFQEPSDDQNDEFDIVHDRRRFNMKDVLYNEGVSEEDMNGVDFQDLDMEGDDERDEDAEFARNQFFASDVDDPLAIHRDKIFGKLEKMVRER
ncbi:hypothetical protein CANARDRAFT_6329 [[Candida] arabinofermentans NRRL YB-2248]|uniref:Transcription factor Iwr1 domain-containing protein n=1 Tax=[Candida] arabinofermentans NRRL YB-2248 TaxID=983967 RepID=A0A1E4T4S9_9ASCO|nr:hypothetical protein CANARDRAFT_6329 [[Candida] arabinofermentans NRRL YB-2248]